MAIGNPLTLTSQVASKTISIIATASQTAFTVTGGYRINQLAVFRNGVRLVDSRDYEARDGATVTLLSAASDGDAMEFQVFDAFQVADTINPYSTYQTIDGNLNITGIVTAATFSITDLDVRNITAVAATFTGQVTYEDVTNVDSIGIATFRDNVNIGVGGTTAFFDVSTGDVGIGTDNPLTKFHIVNGTDSYAIAFISGEDATSEFISLGVKAGEGALTAGGSGSTSTDLILRTANSGTETERVRITSTCNVGIGTSLPVDPLHVLGPDGSSGNPSLSSNNIALFQNDGNTTDGAVITVVAGNAATSQISLGDVDNGNIGSIKYDNSSDSMKLATNGGDRLTINPGGDVNITGITTATQLYEGTTRVATSGKAIAMALIFG